MLFADDIKQKKYKNRAPALFLSFQKANVFTQLLCHEQDATQPIFKRVQQV